MLITYRDRERVRNLRLSLPVMLAAQACADHYERPFETRSDEATISEKGLSSDDEARIVPWLMREGQYPMRGDAGETVCALYDYGSRDEVFTYTESYFLEKMNEQLERSPALKDALARKVGITNVASCEEARQYVIIRHEIAELEPSITKDAAGAGSAELPEVLVEPRGDETIDKIGDGIFGAYAPSIELRIWKPTGVSACSGFLISNGALVTAAHCIPNEAFWPITVRAGDGTCLLPAGGNCSQQPAAVAYGVPHPDYDGTAFHDVGIVLAPSAWPAPANTSSSWIRIAESRISGGQAVTLHGRGVNTHSGAGSGTFRFSMSQIGVDWAGSQHFYANTVAGEGRICKGDSGGPAYATNLYSSAIAVGVASQHDGPDPNCPYPGARFRHAQMGDNIAWLTSWVSCGQFSSNGFVYRRCW